MLTVLLYVAVVAGVAYLAARFDRARNTEELSEFGATFDALQAEKDTAAKMLVRCRAHEAAVKQAERAIATAQYGPIRDGHEV